MNRNVRVCMHDGRVFEGRVVGVDRQNLFIRHNSPCNRNQCRISGFWGGGVITTLALFDLLAIALI